MAAAFQFSDINNSAISINWIIHTTNSSTVYSKPNVFVNLKTELKGTLLIGLWYTKYNFISGNTCNTTSSLRQFWQELMTKNMVLMHRCASSYCPSPKSFCPGKFYWTPKNVPLFLQSFCLPLKVLLKQNCLLLASSLLCFSVFTLVL